MPTSTATPARHVSLRERRARLGVRHLLAPSARADGADGVIAALGALHSTDPATAHLTVAFRLVDADLGALGRALLEDRTAVRHHAMRRTLWVMQPQVAAAAHASCTAAIAQREWVQFAKMLEANGVAEPLDWLAAARERAVDVVRSLGTCTARQLGTAAPELNVPLELAPGKPYSTTQGAHTRLVQNLGFDGTLVRTEQVGTWVSGEYRWTTADPWFEGGFVDHDRDARDGAAELAAVYLRAFGPATTADLQWWAGWTAATTRRALGDLDAVPVTADASYDGTAERVEAWLLPDDVEPVEAADRWATLLPSLDPTIMGWKGRDWCAGDHHALGRSIFDRNGNAGHSIWADGAVIGSWAQRPDGEVVLRYLEEAPARVRRAVDESVDRYLATAGETVVKPRYPAPIQAELIAAGG